MVDGMKMEFLSQLQRNTGNGRVRLPRDLGFHRRDELTIVMPEAAILANMQTDLATFEGWALAAKTLTSAERVILSWQRPSDVNDQHYQRFLYRVHKFNAIFPWFCIAVPSHINDLNIREGEKYVLNVPGTRDDVKPPVNPERLDQIGENALELAIVADTGNCKQLKKTCKLTHLDRQLPVGVFKNKVRAKNEIFTRGKSAVDIWGVDKENRLHLFELKRFTNSRKLGIISELFFYAMVFQDVQGGRFCIKGKFSGAPSPASTDGIVAHFLTPSEELHPLIEKGNIIEELNKWSALAQGSIVRFDHIKISECGNGVYEFL